jgi:hypothetical protein
METSALAPSGEDVHASYMAPPPPLASSSPPLVSQPADVLSVDTQRVIPLPRQPTLIEAYSSIVNPEILRSMCLPKDARRGSMTYLDFVVPLLTLTLYDAFSQNFPETFQTLPVIQKLHELGVFSSTSWMRIVWTEYFGTHAQISDCITGCFVRKYLSVFFAAIPAIISLEQIRNVQQTMRYTDCSEGVDCTQFLVFGNSLSNSYIFNQTASGACYFNQEFHQAISHNDWFILFQIGLVSPLMVFLVFYPLLTAHSISFRKLAAHAHNSFVLASDTPKGISCGRKSRLRELMVRLMILTSLIVTFVSFMTGLTYNVALFQVPEACYAQNGGNTFTVRYTGIDLPLYSSFILSAIAVNIFSLVYILIQFNALFTDMERNDYSFVDYHRCIAQTTKPPCYNKLISSHPPPCLPKELVGIELKYLLGDWLGEKRQLFWCAAAVYCFLFLFCMFVTFGVPILLCLL